MESSRNIFLVGLMGAGKSTVARQLAHRLRKRFIDADHEIEHRTGVRIATIFEIEGEDGFRAREAQVLESLTQLEDVVLATGGGVVLRPENRARLKTRGFVIYLRALPRDYPPGGARRFPWPDSVPTARTAARFGVHTTPSCR